MASLALIWSLRIETNHLQLDRVQNEAVRATLGTTKDTPIETSMSVVDMHPPSKTPVGGCTSLDNAGTGVND